MILMSIIDAMSHFEFDPNIMSDILFFNCLNQRPDISVFDGIILYERSHSWHNIFTTTAHSTKVRFRYGDHFYSKIMLVHSLIVFTHITHIICISFILAQNNSHSPNYVGVRVI